MCTTKQLGWKRIRAGILQCAECDPKVPERTEKIIGRKLLTILHQQPPSAQDNVLVGACSKNSDSAKHRPDLAWVLLDRVIIIEIDENGGHPDYDASCEMARMSRITESIHVADGFKPVIFLRLNPDEFDGFRVTLDNRIETIANDFLALLEERISDATKIYVRQYFYHSKCADKIQSTSSSLSFEVKVIQEANLKRSRLRDNSKSDTDVDDS